MAENAIRFSYRDGVAIVQLVPFTVYLALGVLLCFRHGFRRSDGWVIVVTFSILRVLGACFQLASITHPTRAIYGGALICQGIGLAPLTLLNLGLFVRLNKLVPTFSELFFTAISITSIAGIGIASYGGTESAQSATLQSNTLLKVSVGLFLACYVAFVLLWLIFVTKWRHIPAVEHKLLWLFAACVPFMATRFIYTILGTFVPTLRHRFGVLTGDVTIFLVMSVLEEIIVVAAYVAVGMKLQKLSTELRNMPRRKLKHIIKDTYDRRDSRHSGR